MWTYHQEKKCERCDKLYIAKTGNQKYCIKCWNIIYKERSRLDAKQRSEKRKKKREELLAK